MCEELCNAYQCKTMNIKLSEEGRIYFLAVSQCVHRQQISQEVCQWKPKTLAYFLISLLMHFLNLWTVVKLWLEVRRF